MTSGFDNDNAITYFIPDVLGPVIQADFQIRVQGTELGQDAGQVANVVLHALLELGNVAGKLPQVLVRQLLHRALVPECHRIGRPETATLLLSVIWCPESHEGLPRVDPGGWGLGASQAIATERNLSRLQNSIMINGSGF